jgi:hypothetical protein
MPPHKNQKAAAGEPSSLVRPAIGKQVMPVPAGESPEESGPPRLYRPSSPAISATADESGSRRMHKPPQG